MAWLKMWYITWPLSGVLLGIGFVVPTLWIVSLVGGAYFLYLLQQKTSLRQKIFGAWLAWTIKAAFAVGWMWSTYPIEWLPLDLGQIQVVLIGISWVLTALCLGLGAVVMVITISFIHRYVVTTSLVYIFVLVPLLWVSCETLGSIVFSLFSYGPGGMVSTLFSFGYVGYLLAFHDWLLPAARLVGVFSLGFVFVLMAAALCWSLGQSKKHMRVAVLSLLLLFFASFFPLTKEQLPKTSEGYTVITIDTQLGSRLHTTKEGQVYAAAALQAAVKTALAENTEYVILPEDSRFFDQSRSVGENKSLFSTQNNNPAVVLVDSGRASSVGETVQQAFIYNGPEALVERYHKKYLVPQGEFFPYVYSVLFKVIGSTESLAYLSQGISYQVGPWTSQKAAAANVPGVLFCFESFAPFGVRSLMTERPELPFVAHIASHAWFHKPHTLWSQMEAMLRVQAVWNQQYIVTAGNMVAGNAYAPSGAVWEPEVIATGEGWQLKRTVIPR